MKHFPFLCKAVEYGKQVKCFGRYPLHKVALAPETPENRKRVGGMLSSIFTDIPMEKCSWPTVCVAATNQILHPCTFHFMRVQCCTARYGRARNNRAKVVCLSAIPYRAVSVCKQVFCLHCFLSSTSLQSAPRHNKGVHHTLLADVCFAIYIYGMASFYFLNVCFFIYI